MSKNFQTEYFEEKKLRLELIYSQKILIFLKITKNELFDINKLFLTKVFF